MSVTSPLPPTADGSSDVAPAHRYAPAPTNDGEALDLLNSLTKQIALVDEHGIIVSVNESWREFGLANGAAEPQAVAVGANYLVVCDGSALVPQDAYAVAAQAGVAAVLAGSLPHFELEYPCHSPTEERWFLLRAAPLVGQRRGAVVSHEAITQRWQLEQQRAALTAELLELKTALDQHALVAITDTRGIITYVNDKFCAVSKWSREELIGRDHRIVNSGHHPKEFIRSLWETIRRGEVWQGEVCNRAKDGSIYWVDTTIVPLLGRDSQPSRYIAIRSEITERKLLEELNTEMVGQLHIANRELSEFAYVVSHDLKAPLRGIGSLASWLVSDYADKLDDQGCSQLNLIASRVKRLSLMIDGILMHSRVGRSNDDRSPVDLDALLRSTIDLLAPPPHVTIRIDDSLPVLTTNIVTAQQVFQNLLSNAIDFIDKPIGLISISCQREGPSWHFTVADNGSGIPAHQFDRIFQLFQTLAARDQRERTGVGLTLVKKIVELEGGKVWLESTLGIGTTFHFTLPASP